MFVVDSPLHSVVGVKRKLRRLSSVGCLTTLLKLLCLVCPDYCAREIWKKLSISAFGVKQKLRRLSSVGNHDMTNVARINSGGLYLLADSHALAQTSQSLDLSLDVAI
jgi:hypothetical protein